IQNMKLPLRAEYYVSLHTGLSRLTRIELARFQLYVVREGQPSDKKEFKASQGWLNSFRNRFNLKNVQTTGEVASANEEAAKAYPEQLKEIIEERGYLPEQVFHADETGSPMIDISYFFM
uniref:HTH CENPB-type domain-containing protein n=1 Tax=Chelydra serpentina TaxID=8475 RepID=A0A8C3S0T5_CHESE